MMNQKSKVKVFYEENIVEINKAFYKESQDPTSDEYKLLQEVRKDYPNIKVEIRQIKKNAHKETYAGLTYEYMRNYILLHEKPSKRAEAISEFDELILISQCQTKAKRYPVIKKWFLIKYPKIAEFGLQYNEESKIVNVPFEIAEEKAAS